MELLVIGLVIGLLVGIWLGVAWVKEPFGAITKLVLALVVLGLAACTSSSTGDEEAFKKRYHVINSCTVKGPITFYWAPPDDVNEYGRNPSGVGDSGGKNSGVPVQASGVTNNAAGIVMIAVWPKGTKELHPRSGDTLEYELISNVCHQAMDPKGR